MPTKSFVNSRLNDPSIIKNNTHVDFQDKNPDNVRFVKVNSMPAVGEQLTAKYYVDEIIFRSVHESSLLRLDPDEKLKLDEKDSIILNSTLTSTKTIIELPTKSYVVSLHEINRFRRDLSSAFNDQDNEFDNNRLTDLNSNTADRDPSSDNELANNKDVDDSMGQGNVHRFNQTPENYLKVSVGKDV